MGHDTPGVSFADLLRRHRQAAGLTQEELAERARLSERAVSDLERGARLAPRRETVALLAEALVLAMPERAALLAAARRHLMPPSRSEGEQPESGAAVPGSASAALPAPTGPLVGRETEVARLTAYLDAVPAGRGRLVLLAGAPGIGKTRLAQEIVLQAQARGFHVLLGRCYEQYAALPFSPFVEVLTTALAHASSALRQEVGRRFAALGGLLPDLVDSPPRADGQDARLRLLWAVGRFLAALSAETPVVLVLDDLHWADSVSLVLLLHLARRVRAERILLLGSYRDVEVDHQHPLEAALTDLVRERLVEEVSLRGLPAAGTAALIGAHLGLEAVSEELCELVHARTEGNPFFTEEVVKALVEQGAISPSGQGWDRKAIAEIAVPRSVRAVVGQRVGRLPKGAQHLVRVASVLGQECDLDVLQAAAAQDDAALAEHLDAILVTRLLEERRAGRRVRYAFSHALVGQAVYEAIPRHRARQLHLRCGEVLEQRHGQRPDAAAALARHFVEAGEDVRAVSCALRAGDHAAKLYAHHEAAQQYRLALELLQEAGDAPGAALAQEKLGVALGNQGQLDAALSVLEQAAATWRAAGDLGRLGQVMAAIGKVHAVRATPEAGIQRLQEVLPALEAAGASASLAALYNALHGLFFITGRYVECLSVAARAEDLAREVGDRPLLEDAQCPRGLSLLQLGRVEEALEVLERLIPLTQESGNLFTQSMAMEILSYAYGFRGEFDRAEQYGQQAVDLARRMGYPFWIMQSLTSRSLSLHYLGQWADLRKNLEQCRALSRELGEAWGDAFLLILQSMLSLTEGLRAEATTLLEEAGAIADRTGDLQARRWTAAVAAELAVPAGRAEAARARLVGLLDRPGLEEFHVTVFVLPALAWATLEAGDADQAARTIGEALRRARAADLRTSVADALRVQALIRMRQQRSEEAAQALEEGLLLARAIGYPYAEAHLLEVYGNLYIARGEPAPAREHLEAALAIFRRLGARKDVERSEQLLTTLG